MTGDLPGNLIEVILAIQTLQIFFDNSKTIALAAVILC